MSKEASSIKNLKKVTLRIKALESDTEPVAGVDDGVRVTFIYGIGPSGLSPFEFHLAEKTEGDEFFYSRGDLSLNAAFGHVGNWFLPHMKLLRAKTLVGKIEQIEEPTQEEIVHALAETAQCGDNCCGH